MTSVRPGLIALLGSGETAAAGGRVFDLLGRSLPRGFRAAVLETPAGFELNSERIARRVAAFARLRLKNYGAEVDVVRARRHGTPLSPDDPAVTEALLRAGLIFAGPGSPTYTARQLHGSLAWDRLRARHALGAALLFASAGAIATGRHVLPVYEIYKAGHDLGWQDGLDLLGPFGLNLAIVSHWNNAEGGAEFDTTRCFMGAERFAQLAGLLPPGVTVLGIDEHTALTIDLPEARAQVTGLGRVTIIHAGSETSFGDGASFALAQLGPFRAADLLQSLPRAVIEEAVAVCPAPAIVAPAVAAPGILAPDAVLALANARQVARTARDWAAADQLRIEIEALGWHVSDTPDGPSLAPGSTLQ